MKKMCVGCATIKDGDELFKVSNNSMVCAECRQRMYTCPKCGGEKKLGTQQGLCQPCYVLVFGEEPNEIWNVW